MRLYRVLNFMRLTVWEYKTQKSAQKAYTHTERELKEAAKVASGL